MGGERKKKYLYIQISITDTKIIDAALAIVFCENLPEHKSGVLKLFKNQELTKTESDPIIIEEQQ